MLTAFDSAWSLLAVMGAGLAAGSANAVAGAGSAISFPALVMVGLPPVSANATSAMGLVPGGIAATWSYRKELVRAAPGALWLALPSVIGGAVGAWLLVALPPGWFAAVAPWLVLAAAASVALEPVIRPWVEAGRSRRGGLVAWMGVSVYGGYFGAGMGLLMLTTLGLLGVRDLHHANGLKNLHSVAIKAPAVIYFVVLGLVRWPAAAALVAGSVLGGWLAGALIQRVEPGRLRWVVATVGAVLGVLMLTT